MDRKSNYEIAKEVLAGDWGTGPARRDALIFAGYDYDAVQSIVNAIVYGTFIPEPEDTQPEEAKSPLVIEFDTAKYDSICIKFM